MEKEILAIQEDEIDLKELFKTLWQKRVFIVVFTFVITVLGAVYAFTRTPIYEIDSTYRIGFIVDELIEKPNVLEQKLRLIYNVDNPDKKIEKNNPKITEIKIVKGVENFLKIEIQGFSNKELLNKNKEILDFINNEYKYKYEEFLINTKNKIKDLQYNLNYAEKIEKRKIEKEIEKIEQELTLKVENKINFLKKVKLNTISNKIEFYEKKLKEYEKNIIKINKNKTANKTEGILVATQLQTSQTLILSVKNKLEDLRQLKQDILILQIEELEFEKNNLINEDLKKLQVNLDIELPKKIYDLNQKLLKEKRKLKTNYFKRTYAEGEVLKHKNPIKPKKKLIVVVSFVTGFILSIFLVFFMQFIKSFKEDENE
ncbi:Wzz/FepE/Etk N-terminal domain-containing protein [Malaciobacter marinus]|uniref:Wzz/FepE/Etk N-terminal domain-containing protein n=1 Tax=Malaciobacter marinus TaxID=505249 RepID=UPI003B00D847